MPQRSVAVLEENLMPLVRFAKVLRCQGGRQTER